ncbi:MAG: YraN family protein [Acidobacteria bacterium]|nr:YraN family protein [Acidobacteriota bacterium]
MRAWDHDRALGRRGEDLAHRLLRREGYTIVARNYRTRGGTGEVDLIGWDGDALAFVEVKTRRSAEYGLPDRAVDQEKRRKLVLAAREYVRRAGVPWEKARFDVVNVLAEGKPVVTVVKDAFGRTG